MKKDLSRMATDIDIVIECEDDDRDDDERGGGKAAVAEEEAPEEGNSEETNNEGELDEARPATLEVSPDSPPPALRRSGSMSLFMVGKTFHWVSKAKIAAWFRVAFNLPGTAAASDAGDNDEGAGGGGSSGPATPMARSTSCLPARVAEDESRTPIRMYKVERKAWVERNLTLEPEYHHLFRKHRSALSLSPAATGDPDEYGADFAAPGAVPMMMRSASGVWPAEVLERIHHKMIKDTVERGIAE